MRTTQKREAQNKICVDVNELAAMLSCGTTTARKIADEAESVIKINRRTLYNVNKVQRYVDSMSI